MAITNPSDNFSISRKVGKKEVIVIIGGGAAGFFAAINFAKENPGKEVIILEKSTKLLSKVKISGGGRCNVTHHCLNPLLFSENYPRGSKELRAAFSQFAVKETIEWFRNKGVELKAEADGRMFPVTDDSSTITDCLLQEAEKWGVKVWTGYPVDALKKSGEGMEIISSGKEILHADKVLIAAGGSPKKESYQWLRDLGHTIVDPMPSLFTFNLKDKEITQLMGLSVNDTEVKIAGSNLKWQGPLLITHWGLSGPAVLKLSAWGARILAEKNYTYQVMVKWLPDEKEVSLREKLEKEKTFNPKKKISVKNPFAIPSRLWEYMLNKAGISGSLNWADISKSQINKLSAILLSDVYEAQGKTTYKEEFVTCGGISLKEVDFRTMQSKIVPGLYFAGEILDMDGITGGFNFQAAWTTGWIAAKGMGS
jgi:predicted Rossmann fold flavoprotein